MKLNLAAFASAALLAASAPSALAATINYDVVIDLDPSMLMSYGSLVVPLPGEAFDIAVGDKIEGTIRFANNGRITIFNDPDNEGYEAISGTFSPDYWTTAFSVSSAELLGVSGDLRGPATRPERRSSGALTFGAGGNLTDTWFSFTGIRFSLTYVDLHGPEDFPLTPRVTPNIFVVPSYVSISEGSAVPEPSTWAMMIVGFGAVGALARRRGAQRALA